MSLVNQNYAPVQTITIKAATEIPPYRFVGFGGGVCESGDKALGVSDTIAFEGDFTAVITMGIALIEVAGTVYPGSDLKSDSEGKAVSASSSDYISGRALDDGVAGDLVRVLITT